MPNLSYYSVATIFFPLSTLLHTQLLHAFSIQSSVLVGGIQTQQQTRNTSPVRRAFNWQSSGKHHSVSTTATTALASSTNNNGMDDTKLSSVVPILSGEEVAKSLWKTAAEGGGLYETDVHGVIRCNDNDGDNTGNNPVLDNSISSNNNKCEYRLLYMPMRNRGEIIRLILEEAQVPYEVEVVGWTNWVDGIKHTTPHGKCPVLRRTNINNENMGGIELDLCQEGAITRYLADEFNLAGQTPTERAQVDSLYCLWFATMRNNGVSHDGQFFSIASLKETAALPTESTPTSTQTIRRPKYEDVQRLQAMNDYTRAEVTLMALDFFERQLERTNTGWLVGNSCTYVDLGLFYILFELSEEDNVPDFDVRFHLPRLGQFLTAVSEQTHIKDYIHSPRRMPRYSRAASGKSLYTYVEGKGSPRITS